MQTRDTYVKSNQPTHRGKRKCSSHLTNLMIHQVEVGHGGFKGKIALHIFGTL
jgi:hypothetical protein